MSATRLPGKPLLKIKGLSIISHVSKVAEEANIGDVIVATGDQEIIDDVKSNGFNAILTSNKHKTGTDRIHEALKKSNVRDVDFIMNLQGDEPAIYIDDIKSLNDKMVKNNSDLGTLAAKIKDNKILKNYSVKRSIKIAKKLIKNQGRILVRKSGTEPKIRIMGESENKILLKKCINMISKEFK